MWSNLPIDLLLNIFSHLPPDSLARARAACRSWRATSELAVSRNCHPPWFVALPARGWGLSCYAHNPVKDSWHVLDLDRTTTPMRPIAAIGGLILLKLGSAARLQLAICNPFTNQFRALPALRVARTNPAVGVVEDDGGRGFKIYVAGGMSESAGGGAVYEASVEVYDSSCSGGGWGVVGAMPVEFAVRLTVWTPNESVWSGDGVLYWMTSARAYSVMGFDISSNTWREVSVPMADRLEFAALVRREGRLAVVGEVPAELGIRLLGEKLNWGCVKCVGVDGTICLYKDIGSGIIIWSQGKWSWIHGCIMSFPIKGMLLQPNLARTTF